MARKEGAGGRGGTGSIVEVLASSDGFGKVEDEEDRISRSRTGPSPLKKYVDAARKDLGEYFHFWNDPVPAADENGEPIQATDDDGNPRWNEDGSPMLVMEQTPRTYTKAEVEALRAEFRVASQKDNLPAKRLSLRTVISPPLTEGGDDGPYELQFYVIGRKPSDNGE